MKPIKNESECKVTFTCYYTQPIPAYLYQAWYAIRCQDCDFEVRYVYDLEAALDELRRHRRENH